MAGSCKFLANTSPNVKEELINDCDLISIPSRKEEEATEAGRSRIKKEFIWKKDRGKSRKFWR